MLSQEPAKLLIVDDLPENLVALEALISRSDRQVYKALCADDALHLLLQHEFALAILDVQMPGMNGFELAELMRGTEKTKHIRSCSCLRRAENSIMRSKGMRRARSISCRNHLIRWQ